MWLISLVNFRCPRPDQNQIKTRSKKLITPLTELKEHADPEVSEVIVSIFKTIDSERAIIQAAKKMKNLFEKLKPDGDHALSAEDEQLRQLILKMLKKKPD